MPSVKLRVLAACAGVAAALSCFWITVWYLPLPVLLIAGAAIAGAWPRLGRWLMWIGAFLSSLCLFPYYILILAHPAVPVDRHDINGILLMCVSVASVILVLICDLLLVLDGFKNRILIRH